MSTGQPYEGFPFSAIHRNTSLEPPKSLRRGNELFEDIHTATKLAKPFQETGHLILREKGSVLRSNSPYFQG
jgi:hypothetical protein